MTSTTTAPAHLPTIINPSHLHDPRPNGYSTAVAAPASGRTVFVSGQGGQERDGSLSPDFEAQVEQAYANLAAVLEALGAEVAQVMKLTVYVVDHDMSKLGVLTSGVTRMFGATLPAQTLVPVPKLAVDGMLFEVEAIVSVQ